MGSRLHLRPSGLWPRVPGVFPAGARRQPFDWMTCTPPWVFRTTLGDSPPPTASLARATQVPPVAGCPWVDDVVPTGRPCGTGHPCASLEVAAWGPFSTTHLGGSTPRGRFGPKPEAGHEATAIPPAVGVRIRRLYGLGGFRRSETPRHVPAGRAPGVPRPSESCSSLRTDLVFDTPVSRGRRRDPGPRWQVSLPWGDPGPPLSGGHPLLTLRAVAPSSRSP